MPASALFPFVVPDELQLAIDRSTNHAPAVSANLRNAVIQAPFYSLPHTVKGVKRATSEAGLDVPPPTARGLSPQRRRWCGFRKTDQHQRYRASVGSLDDLRSPRSQDCSR
jgi:hypothetical protein